MTEAAKAALSTALISGMVSALVSGVGVFFLQSYIKSKAQESTAAREKRRKDRQTKYVLDDNWQHAVGRVLFWMKDSLDKGREHANGNLDSAYAEFTDAEIEKKNFERQMLAERADENMER